MNNKEQLEISNLSHNIIDLIKDNVDQVNDTTELLIQLTINNLLTVYVDNKRDDKINNYETKFYKLLNEFIEYLKTI